MDFPQYRKYPNNLSYFEVLAPDEFRELKIIGQRYEIIHIKATIWPDHNYISDLLSNSGGYYEATDREDFYRQLKMCETSMQPLH